MSLDKLISLKEITNLGLKKYLHADLSMLHMFNLSKTLNSFSLHFNILKNIFILIKIFNGIKKMNLFPTNLWKSPFVCCNRLLHVITFCWNRKSQEKKWSI